jgi:superfamily I DNA/RNA helicase
VAGGVGDVRALTFHGLGVMILKRAKIAREHIGEPTLGQWRRLAALAKRAAGDDGVWLDPGHAKACLSDIKLGLLMNAAEYAASVDGRAQAMAALYAAYEELQREEDGMDFDDLILGSLQLLRDDRRQRERWKQQWECLLVDEYQDIEPAQELLVRILAAPHDQLFCVGDEDQTLYAFRRASVERIICLDMLYPALQRIALEMNYRCPAAVVAASARLIAPSSSDDTRARYREPIGSSEGVASMFDMHCAELFQGSRPTLDQRLPTGLSDPMVRYHSGIIGRARRYTQEPCLLFIVLCRAFVMPEEGLEPPTRGL